MASKSLPKCFISYCHENADFASIEAFEKELEVISKERELGVKSYAVTGNLSSRLKSCPRNFPIHLGSTAKQSLSNRRL
ncbi:MAG: hypothetical protein ACI9SP_002790, partial [Arenicella sp.]